MMTPTELADVLVEMPMPSAVSIGFTTESYFDAIRGVVDIFASKKGLETIYITSQMPSNSIIDVLTLLEIDMKRIHFIDCVSQVMGGSVARQDNVYFVESPTMLENIMLKVEYLMRKNKGRDSVVILDAINSLAIHNNTKILSEFFHILINSLRAKNAYTIIFSMEDFSSEELKGMMSLICENVISMSGKREG
jgi:KaiC/GvpD/RAD55 family RecA-like ATPase